MIRKVNEEISNFAAVENIHFKVVVHNGVLYTKINPKLDFCNPYFKMTLFLKAESIQKKLKTLKIITMVNKFIVSLSKI